jgi:hypothetical protein
LARVIRLTPGYLRGFKRLRLERARPALAATLSGLSRDELPGPADFETVIPPRLRAWVRRLPGHNLWLSYTFDAVEVRVLMIVASPPIPFDE